MFSDKIVLVTGATRGLGFALAKRLSALGCRLALCARAKTFTAPWASDLPEERLLYVSTDISDPQQVNSFAQSVAQHFGGLDVLINNASVLGPGERLADATTEQLLQAVNINVNGSLAMYHACAPLLRANKGRFIQVVSSAGFVPISHMGTYCLTKSAQVMLTRQIALEEPDLLAYSLDPDMMDTDMQISIKESVVPRMAEPYRSLFEQSYRNGQVHNADEAAQTLAWLALSDVNAPSGTLFTKADDKVRHMVQEWLKGITGRTD